MSIIIKSGKHHKDLFHFSGKYLLKCLTAVTLHTQQAHNNTPASNIQVAWMVLARNLANILHCYCAILPLYDLSVLH